jgi:hypothetical protein
MYLPLKALRAHVGILRRKSGIALHKQPVAQWEWFRSAAGCLLNGFEQRLI